MGRIGIAAQSVGMARAAIEIAIAYAKDRKSFGQPIIQHQAVGFRLASLATQSEAASQLVLSAAALKDACEPCLTQASMTKLLRPKPQSTFFKRYGTLAEQVAPILFLASDEASYITGSILPVAGGDLG